MRRFTAICLVGFASLSLNGCALYNRFFGERQVEDLPLEGTGSPAEPDAAEAETEEFGEPLVSAVPNASAIASAELIQSTDSSERVQQIQMSRPDPYATVPIPPAPTAPPPAPEGPGEGGGLSPDGGGVIEADVGDAGEFGEDGDILALPELPEPELANAVAVTGVVRVGGETYAIIEAPSEPTSRYVRAGQRISNNRVLVKRIELRGGSDPVVVFEEMGIEVARPVGSTGEPGDGPTATLPVPPQVMTEVASLADN